MNSVRDFCKNNQQTLERVLGTVCVILFCVFLIHNSNKQDEQLRKNRELHNYNMTIDGFKNVLKGTYGDSIEVTNTDWGSHSNYGIGDAWGQYLDNVTVTGCGENELVLVAYYTRNTGATWYAVAEPGMNEASNGWGVSRDGDRVTFNVNSCNNDGGYKQVAIFNPEQKLLYVPAFKG